MKKKIKKPKNPNSKPQKMEMKIQVGEDDAFDEKKTMIQS